MKITMLGTSGSGKTTYMSALYDVLHINSVKGYRIQPSADDYFSSFARIGEFGGISFVNRGLRFPDGTIQTTVWPFDLYYFNRLAAQFEWIDYRGGLLDGVLDPDASVDGQSENQLHELLAHISQSVGILVFVDSIILTRTPNVILMKRQSGASAVATVLRNYAIYFPNRPLNIIVMLTKADSDLIGDDWKADKYRQLLDLGRSLFADVVAKAPQSSACWRSAIAAVGCIGMKNLASRATPSENLLLPATVETRITAYPEPFNVAEPLFYCLGEALYSMEQYARRSAAQELVVYEDAVARSRGIARALSMITGLKDPKQIADAAWEKRMAEFRLIAQIKEHVSDISAVASRSVYPL